jgi:hypothetical protein
VSEYVEKKGQFSYLSWPYAVSQLRLFDETATWEVRRFEGLPYLTTENGTFVEVAVTVKGITLSQIHPVLDSKNRPLMAPNAFDINTSLQRCLVKAIALHGLGLKVYAGEDLPLGDSQAEPAGIRQVHSRHVQTGDSSVLLTANQLRYIRRLISETQADETQLLGFFGFESLEKIPKAEVNRVIRVLESNREKEAA